MPEHYKIKAAYLHKLEYARELRKERRTRLVRQERRQVPFGNNSMRKGPFRITRKMRSDFQRAVRDIKEHPEKLQPIDEMMTALKKSFDEIYRLHPYLKRKRSNTARQYKMHKPHPKHPDKKVRSLARKPKFY